MQRVVVVVLVEVVLQPVAERLDLVQRLAARTAGRPGRCRSGPRGRRGRCRPRSCGAARGSRRSSAALISRRSRARRPTGSSRMLPISCRALRGPLGDLPAPRRPCRARGAAGRPGRRRLDRGDRVGVSARDAAELAEHRRRGPRRPEVDRVGPAPAFGSAPSRLGRSGVGGGRPGRVTSAPASSPSSRAPRMLRGPLDSARRGAARPPRPSRANPSLTAPSRAVSRAGSSGAVEPSGWVAERTSTSRRWWVSRRLTSSIVARPTELRKSGSSGLP